MKERPQSYANEPVHVYLKNKIQISTVISQNGVLCITNANMWCKEPLREHRSHILLVFKLTDNNRH